MWYPKALRAGLVAAGLVGCVCSASACTVGASSSPTLSTPGPTPAVVSQGVTKVGARAAAAQFYSLSAASLFKESWSLLAPAAERQVPLKVWVGVHDGCPLANAGVARIIKSVTVFGNAAIITETVAGATSRRGTVEDVFNYINGRWGYMPGDLSIYKHRSVKADIAAARAAGFCSGSQASPL